MTNNHKITLLLHNIRSTYNIGAIFRTAEGFGVTKIILTGYTPYPELPGDSRLPHLSQKITQQIHKSALGAEKLVDFSYFENVDDFLSINQLPIVALEQSPQAISLSNYQPVEDIVLVLGEEVSGINHHLLTKCDVILEIPMIGQKESFNVSVAAGIALYELTRNENSILR